MNNCYTTTNKNMQQIFKQYIYKKNIKLFWAISNLKTLKE